MFSPLNVASALPGGLRWVAGLPAIRGARGREMVADSEFDELLGRVRQGDASAASELVRLYEPEIRRVVRIRLASAKLRQQMDSVDVCQSVLGEFFFRATLGQFEFEDPSDLVALLARMARNNLLNKARHHHAAKRDVGRQVPITDDSPSLPGDDRSPSSIVAREELLDHCRRLLSDDERKLAEERANGRSWDELATAWGVPAETLRKRHARALDRVAESLGKEHSHGP